jgi:hypothetical protein
MPANYLPLAQCLRAQLEGNKPTSTDLSNAKLLCKRVKRFNTYCINEVNNGLTRDEFNRKNNTKYAIANLLASYNIHTIQFDDDPRGYSVKLINLPHPNLWLFKDFTGNFVIPYSDDLN